MSLDTFTNFGDEVNSRIIAEANLRSGDIESSNIPDMTLSEAFEDKIEKRDESQCVLKMSGFSATKLLATSAENIFLKKYFPMRGSSPANEIKPIESNEHGIPEGTLASLTKRLTKTGMISADDDFNIATRSQALRKYTFSLDAAAVENSLDEDGLPRLGESKDRMASFFQAINAYADVNLSTQDVSELRAATALTALHIASHVERVRQQVLSNTTELKMAVERARERSAAGAGIRDLGVDMSGDDRFRDQGFNRARVLVLAPFRAQARFFIEEFVALHPLAKGEGVRQAVELKEEGDELVPTSGELATKHKKLNLYGKDRYMEEFAEDDETRGKMRSNRKSEDHIELLGGNCDDAFKLGINVSGSSIKLYSSFEDADIIVASPLSLKLSLAKDKQEIEKVLSSIEVTAILRADGIEQQNWEHVEDILAKVNCRPSDISNCDIRRLRLSAAAGQAKNLRQTILISSLRTPLTRSLSNRQSNFRSPTLHLYTSSSGDIFGATKELGLRQLFHHLPCLDRSQYLQEMARAFENTMWPSLLQRLNRLIIIVPTYVEFLIFQKALTSLGVQFHSLHESSSKHDLSRVRMLFATGKKGIHMPLLTTERFLHYKRYRIKGGEAVAFPLGPPTNPLIYQEVVNGLTMKRHDGTTNNGAIAVVFYSGELNGLALERIVGAEYVKKLMAAQPYKAFLL